MKNNRRDFLKLSGLTGLSIAGGGIFKVFADDRNNHDSQVLNQLTREPDSQRFNMSGMPPPDSKRSG